MNKVIENDTSKLILELTKNGINDLRVLKCIEEIPRSIFIESSIKSKSNLNIALPIGCGQTISQPFVVAFMSQSLNLNKKIRVLEIGTGSGYQTSILSKLFTSVTTIERIKSLHLMAKKRLSDFNYNNITFLHGDGFHGHKSNSPYDAIIMTASPNEIPSCLVSQLKPSGRIILPLNINGSQKLFRVKNTKNGLLKKEVDDVLFVPMLEGVS